MYPAFSDLLAVAVEAVRTAGRHARDNAGRRCEVAQRSANDIKLHLDLECQERAEAVIRSAWPDHRLFGEEKGSLAAGPDPLWIIDPLDGTVNFFHGLPYWCSSVAVRVGGEVVAGAVYAPVPDEIYAASAEAPATCNDRPIRVSETARLEDAVLLMGLSKSIGRGPTSLDALRAVSARVMKIRLFGAAALDLCQVAAGRADGYFESALHLWDWAAADLILRRAGGRSGVLEPIDAIRARFLGANAGIHDAFSRIVRGALHPAAKPGE